MYHAIIIPNYKEELDILESTLQQIAGHTQAKQRYLVFLAMEGHEEGSVLKG